MIRVARDTPLEGVITLALSSPDNRNALSRRLLRDLRDELEAADRRPTVRAILLSADGPAFCSGGDLREALADGMRETSTLLVSVQRAIVSLRVPVVAQVEGAVVAGGIGIVAACDVVVATVDASFAFPEARMGMAPAVASLTALPVMGRRASALRVLTATKFSATEALADGLITSVCTSDELESTVSAILEAITRCSPQGIAESKGVLAAPLLQRIDDLGPGAADHVTELFASDVMRDSMNAFVAQR